MFGTIGATIGAKTAAALGAKAPDAKGFYDWLTGSPIRIILALVAIGVIMGASRGKLTKAVQVMMIVVVGLFIMYGDTAMKGIATWLGGYFS